MAGLGPIPDEVDGSRSRHLGAKMGCYQTNPSEGATRMEITTVGLDLAKHVFQVHAVDAEGRVVVRKALRRAQMMPFFQKLPRCLIGIEACGTSHFWARELIAMGQDVRLMPAAYVKPYVKRGKTDAGDKTTAVHVQDSGPRFAGFTSVHHIEPDVGSIWRPRYKMLTPNWLRQRALAPGGSALADIRKGLAGEREIRLQEHLRNAGAQFRMHIGRKVSGCVFRPIHGCGL
jgi:transposase